MPEHQGSSQVTAIKEIQIYGVVKMRLTQRKNQGYISNIYVYDIFSGDGVNIVDGSAVWGSPVEIARAISDSGISTIKPVSFIASDLRIDAVERLQNTLKDMAGFRCICEQSKASDQLRKIYSNLRNQNSHALIVIDPNGPGTLPFNEIKQVAYTYNKRADLFINISETAINRILNCGITKDKNWWAGYDNFESIILDIFSFYKQAWVRRVLPGDRQKWRFICFWSWGRTKSGWCKQYLDVVNSPEELKRILKEGVNNGI